MADWLIQFSDKTCPSCGKGKILPICKYLHKYKQDSTVIGYKCDSCNTQFQVKYELNESDNTYNPVIMYRESDIQNFKNYFLKKENKNEKESVNV